APRVQGAARPRRGTALPGGADSGRVRPLRGRGAVAGAGLHRLHLGGVPGYGGLTSLGAIHTGHLLPGTARPPTTARTFRSSRTVPSPESDGCASVVSDQGGNANVVPNSTQPVPSEKSAGPPTLGFLTVLQEASGYLGGYLVTNLWGRPLEF